MFPMVVANSGRSPKRANKRDRKVDQHLAAGDVEEGSRECDGEIPSAERIDETKVGGSHAEALLTPLDKAREIGGQTSNRE